LAAARKLLKAATWPGLFADAAGLVWGECQGSGAAPYRVVIQEEDFGYKCTCPSRKFPCKHSLALMWLRAEGKAAFQQATTPEWVADWVRRRKPANGAPAKEAKEEAGQAGIKSMVAALAAEEAPADPKAEARSAAARERNRRDREEAVLSGLADLDIWLADQLDTGLAGFASQARKSCATLVQRLVDAKAPGLASRLEALPGRLLAMPEGQRGSAAVAELGQFHLIAEAYRRQDSLPAELRADVRRVVGWAQTRNELLEDQAALRISGAWRVVATLSEVQPDRLRRLETWLIGEGQENSSASAVLLDFVPVSTGPARSPFSAGERLAATLVYYVSPAPLRAQIAVMDSPASASGDPIAFPEQTLGQALDGYGRALALEPWLERWPLGFANCRLRQSGAKLWLVSREDDGTAVPLAESQSSTAAPLECVDRIDGFGIWNGSALQLTIAETALGRWEAS
jgi:hypothetical protein